MFVMTLWCLVGISCAAMPYIKFEDVFYGTEQACIEAGKDIIDLNPAIPSGLWQVECRRIPAVDDSIKDKVG